MGLFYQDEVREFLDENRSGNYHDSIGRPLGRCDVATGPVHPGAMEFPILSYAFQSRSLADPAGSGAVAAAVRWLEGTLLGTAATSVAVICVAAVGLMMLSGRIDARRAGTVLIGCFILFGAPGIAAALHALAGGGDSPPPAAEPFYEPPPYVPPPAPPPPPANPDPYAGASVPGG
jgi:type IV secretory pathway VirB2 component (pilin)